MMDVALLQEPSWTENGAWEEIATTAVEAAINATPYASLSTIDIAVEVAVKLSDNAEVQALNRNYRHKDKPTNILSFPQTPPDLLLSLASSVTGAAAGDDAEVILGDMILAHTICVEEAHEKQISLGDHFTHLIVHGTLHLLGYDHIEDSEAAAMEALETQILAGLGISDPYGDRD